MGTAPERRHKQLRPQQYHRTGKSVIDSLHWVSVAEGGLISVRFTGYADRSIPGRVLQRAIRLFTGIGERTPGTELMNLSILPIRSYPEIGGDGYQDG